MGLARTPELLQRRGTTTGAGGAGAGAVTGAGWFCGMISWLAAIGGRLGFAETKLSGETGAEGAAVAEASLVKS